MYKHHSVYMIKQNLLQFRSRLVQLVVPVLFNVELFPFYFHLIFHFLEFFFFFDVTVWRWKEKLVKF